MAVTPGEAPQDVAALWDARVEDSVRLGVRFLMRANSMDALYGQEVARTNRMGIGPTGLHEWAWLRFGLDFNDLLDETKSVPFWSMMARLSDAAKQEGDSYARELGRVRPTTVTTVKPAGTTSKLFGLTEGAHLPARRQYLRWVQFKGVLEDGTWIHGSDPLLAEYAARGYPMRTLKTFPGMTVVGFPTVPLLLRLGLGERTVTAGEASPTDQYRWLRLLEQHWIGAEQGNQVSYTLKSTPTATTWKRSERSSATSNPRCVAAPFSPAGRTMNWATNTCREEEVSAAEFDAIVLGIEIGTEDFDMVHLECAGGVCPI